MPCNCDNKSIIRNLKCNELEDKLSFSLWIEFKFQPSHFPIHTGYNGRLPKYCWPMMSTSTDPLHGKKLADILDELLDYYDGFEGLSRKIEIRCFCIDPSVKSSLRFLRTTPWAREKVESLYLYVLRQKAKQKS